MSGGFWFENIRFGFCLDIKGKTGWDCLQVVTGLNTEKIKDDIDYATSFYSTDQYIERAEVTGLGLTFFKDDDSSREGSAWRGNPAKSSKECPTGIDRSGSQIV